MASLAGGKTGLPEALYDLGWRVAHIHVDGLAILKETMEERS
jgi:hypothetical protein